MKAKADAEIFAYQSALKDTIIAEQAVAIKTQQKKIFFKTVENAVLKILLMLAAYKIVR